MSRTEAISILGTLLSEEATDLRLALERLDLSDEALLQYYSGPRDLVPSLPFYTDAEACRLQTQSVAAQTRRRLSALQAGCDALEMLVEVQDVLQEYVDIEDSDNEDPSPNWAMKLLTQFKMGRWS